MKIFESEDAHLLHSTSVIRYPVILNGGNYRGVSPTPFKSKLLSDFIRNNFVDEINNFQGAIIIPLGTAVKKVLKQLQSEELISELLILENFPHPSGLNGHRHNSSLPIKTV